MNQQEKSSILEKAQEWFRDSVAPNHIKNTKKLIKPEAFNINPFLASYLANFLTGSSNPEDIAKALIYPRVLGTSITTTFGNQIQKFTNDVLSSYGSVVSGIDIEFEDKVDGNKVYCQLKSGPNTINKDDVETIAGHFKSVIQLGRTNNLRITHSDMVVGVIYGQPRELSGHYKRITKQYDYPVYIGKEFWYRLTGDEYFYYDLGIAIGEVASEANFKEELEDVISELSQHPQIIEISSKS